MSGLHTGRMRRVLNRFNFYIMKRLVIIIFSLLLSLMEAKAAYVHVDYDYEGATLAEAAYVSLAKAENLNVQSIVDILDHYTSAEVASAGIWLSKFLERKALKNEMIFSSAENHYYKVILFLVTKRITPRIIRIGSELLHYPEQFLYWGPFLFKTCEDVMNLCAQFEAIVTNAKVGFSGVSFVQLNPALQEYFDFSKLGNVNWQQMWDRLTNFPTPKWEDFREDFKELFGKVSPVNLAIAGEENIKGHASHIFDKFAEAPESLPELFDQVQDAFHEVTSGAAVKSILEGVIGDLKDSLAFERLFDVSQYNVGNYINNYVNQLKGQFYTQRWYIYHEVKGSGSSSPQEQPSYYLQEYSIVLVSGGSEVSVLYSQIYDSRNGDLDSFMNEFDRKYRKLFPIYGIFGRLEKKAGEKQIYYLPVTTVPSDDEKIIDYEDLFDSRTNHEAIFEKEFEQRRKTLEKDQEVSDPLMLVRYYIGKDEKHYYELESTVTVRNAGSASFTVTCRDQVELAKGGFNFKVNERYNESKMNEYAYPKGLIPEKQPEDTSLWEEKIEDYERRIRENEDSIFKYQSLAKELLAIADTTTNVTEKKNLQRQASDMTRQANRFIQTNVGLQDSLDEVQDIYDKYQVDYADDLDGPYRIPTLENDLAGDFRLHWDAAGTWSGHTYTRPAHIVGMADGVRFIAEVSRKRREMRFLGIRYHRAIIGVEYRLVSETETSEIVDVIKLTDDMDDQQKAALINNRRSEIQQEFPGCNVQVVKNEKDGIEKESSDEAVHLLWMSDRVALARFIEYRLRQIDGQLSFIERNLYVKKNVLADFKKAFMQGIPRWRTSTPAGAAFQRWMDIGNGR